MEWIAEKEWEVRKEVSNGEIITYFCAVGISPEYYRVGYVGFSDSHYFNEKKSKDRDVFGLLSHGDIYGMDSLFIDSAFELLCECSWVLMFSCNLDTDGRLLEYIEDPDVKEEMSFLYQDEPRSFEYCEKEVNNLVNQIHTKHVKEMAKQKKQTLEREKVAQAKTLVEVMGGLEKWTGENNRERQYTFPPATYAPAPSVPEIKPDNVVKKMTRFLDVEVED